MRTLMSGAAWSDYGQLYVESGEVSFEMDKCFGGQVNGLCGGAVPGTLFLMTGTNVGEVDFTVELHDQAPPVGEEWEDVVEVSFRPEGPAALYTWANEDSWSLDELEPIDYRVRYCAVGMDDGRDEETRGPSRERYLLQFWPAPPEPDRIVKQTSEHAAYWHRYAAEQPPPPTAEEKAEALRRAREEQERAAAQARLEAEERRWGGRLPSDALRQLRGSALLVVGLDRPLGEAIAEAGPVVQRDVARWAVRRAFTEAGLADIDWIAPALAAMDRGEPLPPPFGDGKSLWELLKLMFADDRVPKTPITSLDGKRHNVLQLSSLDGKRHNVLQQGMALPALFHAHEENPLKAALDALWAGVQTFGPHRHGVLFAELRESFPALA
ncbi:hypothetical protein ALI22I_01540 [Saccharothrix sp. ALI-22-I]|uniref:hypothetical protein n=1 Tax=Saccharothrix sp. ALI-22-I TaxID=1933778 RepID=UPI00097C0159|nr:hypothetical protein [Saccharothrix sp. ALI-22-I]ONI92835.1 hypothetical protein ALI22I_01540 [Saccharothrix sp. ALI-22-I]